MKAVFLCGGVGKRMSPITEDKFLLKFLGQPLLKHQIEMAVGAGLNEFVIIGNPQNIDKIAEIANNIPNISVRLAVQREPLGIANALESAADLLSDEIMVVNPNDVFESSAYSGILKEYKKGGAVSYLLGYRVREHFPGGYMVVNEKNELQKIVEKPERGAEPSNLVNIVVHLHTDSKKLFDYLRKVKTTNDDVYELAMSFMTKDGYKIKVVDYNNLWAAIKYPWHIFTIVEYFLNQGERRISPTAKISEKATIEGKVIIDDGVQVLENAVIRGPCYVGRNSIIGNNVLIRGGSHIGENCVVGHSTEIKHSYIGDDCWFHFNYVGDSIIAKGCSLGAGTITANLRFDEKNISLRVQGETVDSGYHKFGAIMGDNCKTGINVSIMPGVRLGANSVVGAHVNLTHDLEPNKVITAEPHYQIMKKGSKRETKCAE